MFTEHGTFMFTLDWVNTVDGTLKPLDPCAGDIVWNAVRYDCDVLVLTGNLDADL